MHVSVGLGQVGLVRERFFTPRLRFKSYDELNAWLMDKCIAWAKAHGHPERPDRTIWEVFEEERPKLVPNRGRFDGFYALPASVSKTCLVRFDNNKYSVSASAVGRPVDIATIEAYAKASGYEIVDTFYDAAVSGADPVGARPGFAEMPERLMSNGARNDHRGEPGPLRSRRHGAACGPRSAQGRTESPSSRHRRPRTSSRTPRLRTSCAKRWARSQSSRRRPSSPSWRPHAGASVLPPARRLRGARSHIEARPDVVKLAKALARKKPKGGRLSLRKSRRS